MNSVKKTVILLSIVIPAFFTTGVSAQDFEFRFVNNQYLFSQILSKEGPSLDQDIQDFGSSLIYTLQRKEEAIKSARYELQELEGTALSNAEQQLEAMEKDFTDFRQSAQTKMQRKEQQIMDSIHNRINEAIQTVADQNNIDHVIPTHDENGKQIVLYFSPQEAQKYDITLQVLEYLNSN